MWKFAAHNLLSQKLRTALALLGLTVAILAMVGLFSVAEGLDASFDDAFTRIPGLVAMQPGAPVPLFSSLPAEWEDELEELPGIRTVNAEVWQRANLIEGQLITKKPRFLFGMHLPSRVRLEQAVYRDAVLPGGRFLGPEDVGSTNTLVSKSIAEEYEVGVGDVLSVNGVDLTIVGVYHTKSLLLDVAILLDIGTVRRMTGFNPDSVSAFYIEPDGSVPSDDIVAAVEERFRGRKLPPPRFGRSDLGLLVDSVVQYFQQPQTPSPSRNFVSQEDGDDDLPIEVKSATDWAEQVDEFSGDLDLFLTLMTSIGVTIAVLSILNTMLMSVSERIVEFGVLRANGWSPRDVMALVTLESVYIGLLGGVLGCAGGWAGTLIVNAIFSDRLQLYASPSLLAFSLAFSIVVGVLGGLYPAYWAMRMSPMDAIRRG